MQNIRSVVLTRWLQSVFIPFITTQSAGGMKISARIGCHTFRHSFATYLLESGYGIHTIHELLDHSDVKTTMVYTHVLNRGGLGRAKPHRSDVIYPFSLFSEDRPNLPTIYLPDSVLW